MEALGIRMRLTPKRGRRPPFLKISLFYEDDSCDEMETSLSENLIDISFESWKGKFSLRLSRLSVVDASGQLQPHVAFWVVHPDGTGEGRELVMEKPSLLIGFGPNGLDLRFE